MSIIEGSAIDPMAQAMWDPSGAGPVAASPLAAAAAAASGIPSMQAAASGIPSMQVDWKETAEGHVIKADLPGVRKEEVKVELERGGVLAISGERQREVDEQGDTWRHLERSSGKFTRRLQLPENAKVEGVKASMEHGVLTITVPKVNPEIESARQMVPN